MQLNRLVSWIAFGLGMTLLAAGQTTLKPAPLNTPPQAAKKTPVAQGASGLGASAQQDKQIETAIRVKLEKSKVGKDGFKVHVQGGVATWEGTTNVLQHKGAATRMAKTAGAKGVVNHIKVSDAAKQKAADNLDQGRRRVQVKRGDTRSDQRTQE